MNWVVAYASILLKMSRIEYVHDIIGAFQWRNSFLRDFLPMIREVVHQVTKLESRLYNFIATSPPYPPYHLFIIYC